jgi:hypothetical protein
MFKAPTLGLFTALLLIPLAVGCGDKKDSKSSDNASKADDKDDKKSKKDDKDDKKSKKDDKPAKKDDKEATKKPNAALDTAKYGSQINEAKNAIGKIARGALMAYERESMGEGGEFSHALCKSATAVPEKVPSAGESYSPKSDAGADFNAGDDKTGWPCLKFTGGGPVYFQYSYTEGSTPKLAARGEDVAKGEAGFFEICAETDFEPGGKTTLICQTGQVKSDRVMLGTQLVELGEGE